MDAAMRFALIAVCVSIAPTPFGGVGGVDAAMRFALIAVRVSIAPALVAVCRLFGFRVPIAPALVALGLLPRAGRGLERAAAAAAPAPT